MKTNFTSDYLIELRSDSVTRETSDSISYSNIKSVSEFTSTDILSSSTNQRSSVES